MTDEELGAVTSIVDVATSSGSYPVHISAGLLDELPRLLVEYSGATRFAIIADDHVALLYGERIGAACLEAGLDVTVLTFPAGEASKNRKSWSILTDEMLEAGLGRDCCVVGVGGGVTTDLAGFVAATYLRGVPVIQVPTSYLAMIDASVGGKTGVDVRAGKNLVGAFHPPAAVLADPEVLGTLPQEERAQGLVEAFKHGTILDAGHFEHLIDVLPRLLDAEPEVAAQAVLTSVQIKAAVVGRDEFEGGYRQVLNFGHTLGHAIEAASGYTMGHGSAIALGMLGEADIGERLGVTDAGTRDTLQAALSAFLALDGSTIDAGEASGFLSADKKVRAGRSRYVLVERVGTVSEGEQWTHDVPDALALEALRRVLAGS